MKGNFYNRLENPKINSENNRTKNVKIRKVK